MSCLKLKKTKALMGGDFEAEGLVDPSFKASSFPSSITFLNHLLLLWFLTQSKVPCTKRPNCVPRAQSYHNNKTKTRFSKPIRLI